MDSATIRRLISEAMRARTVSYSPYSSFSVGAALLAENGDIFRGCNIESVSFTPTSCAERTAFFNAVSQGVRAFTAIAVVGGHAGDAPAEICAPCGVCRQIMAEFCVPGEFLIILAKSPEEYIVKTLEELLPMSFGPELLPQKKKC